MCNNKEIEKTNKTLENISKDDELRERDEILARLELEEKWNKQSLLEHGMEKGIEEGEQKAINKMAKR